MHLAALIGPAVVVGVFLLLLGWAVVDNKVKYGCWRPGRHERARRPEHVTDADWDAWLGGHGGAP